MNLIEITVLPGKGRGYKATTTIAAGTTIHVSEPLATTVSQEWIPETCASNPMEDTSQEEQWQHIQRHGVLLGVV
ncbi:hypothetical protein G6F42_028907 [Rhizopus arrhizus]|nr:hypothetical protein G6F42_028907 [Rhizopus arrhizus]